MGAEFNKKRTRRRAKLFQQQGGRCHWCHGMMVLPLDGEHVQHPPENIATIEHLFDRFHPARTMPAQGHEQRWGLACRACNNARGARREREQGIEELRRRARGGRPDSLSGLS